MAQGATDGASGCAGTRSMAAVNAGLGTGHASFACGQLFWDDGEQLQVGAHHCTGALVTVLPC